MRKGVTMQKKKEMCDHMPKGKRNSSSAKALARREEDEKMGVAYRTARRRALEKGLEFNP